MDMQSLFDRLGGIKAVGTGKIKPMSEAEISTIEKELGGRFPDDYRRFLATFGASTFNGASPDNPYVVFRTLNPLPSHITNTDKALFNAFYGADRDGLEGYSLRARARFFKGRMPETIIPIGDDGGAGLICLGIKGAEAGKVYYWDQANEPLDEEDYLEDFGKQRPPEAMFQNVYLIANSFDDFLHRLEVKKA